MVPVKNATTLKLFTNSIDVDISSGFSGITKNTRVIKTISYNQARQPIYKTSLKSYSNYDNYLKDLKILI